MADNSKFGGGRGAQFGDRISPGAGGEGHCGQCEAMLADALDGTLTPADQALFDAHMAICGPCSDMLADARRGAAWLEMLRDPRPEPPAALLERILAQTSGTALIASAMPAPVPEAVFVSRPGARPGTPFGQRFLGAIRNSFSVHGLFQPRLAMTAAMAFFSIALTMNLTGIRLSELRAGDLRPSSVSLGFHSAQARVARYYEGLRVVYELESRVHELETDSDAGSTTDTQKTSPAPDSQGAQPPDQQPGGSSPQTTRPRTKAPGPGSSRRESLMPSARMLAVNDPSFFRRQPIGSPASIAIGSAETDCIPVPNVRALA